MDAMKKFSPGEVSENTFKKLSLKRIIRELVNAGMHAPTARNLQPWHFVVVDDGIRSISWRSPIRMPKC